MSQTKALLVKSDVVKFLSAKHVRVIASTWYIFDWEASEVQAKVIDNIDFLIRLQL